MRRLLLAGLGAMLLACSGIGESILEGVIGEEISIRDDGMDMTLPNDGQLNIFWGESATHPDRLDLPRPAGATLGLSGVVAFPDGPPTDFVIYDAPGPKDTVAAHYTQVMSGKGLSVEQSEPDPGTINLEATQGDIFYLVAISPSDQGGDRVGLILGRGSKEALEKGLEARP